jgi:hypothetical protein
MYPRKLNIYFRLAMVIRETKLPLLFSYPIFALNIATSVDMIPEFCLSYSMNDHNPAFLNPHPNPPPLGMEFMESSDYVRSQYVT